MRAKLDITLTVNGRERHAEVEPRMLLADVLRHEFGLKGTHIGWAMSRPMLKRAR